MKQLPSYHHLTGYEENFIRDKIISIEEFYTAEKEGFKITTNQYIYKISISSTQLCCEVSRYMVSQCHLDDFIGASIKNVKCVDDNYSKRLVKLAESVETKVENCCFLIFDTSKGTPDFTVYNEHNGYYCHIFVSTKQA